MRVVTRSFHTGYEYELAKTGHEFFALRCGWDHGQRPQPKNWKLIDDLRGTYDVGVVGSWESFEWGRSLGIPLLWVVHADLSHGQFNGEIEKRVSAVVFSSSEVAGHNNLVEQSKKKIIEHGVDAGVYTGWGDGPRDVLCVGNQLPTRSEKGLDRLMEIAKEVQVDLLGFGNEGLGFAVGAAKGYDDLIARYKQYRVFLNPSSIVSTSLLEAMVTGMPVVTFRPSNFKSLIVDGQTGYVVDTVAEAVSRVRQLLGNDRLRVAIAVAGREAARLRFSAARFQGKWSTQFVEAVASWRARR